jgi:DNA-directed RNA polymerase subunit RPC12/RpoP
VRIKLLPPVDEDNRCTVCGYKVPLRGRTEAYCLCVRRTLSEVPPTSRQRKDSHDEH